MAKSIVISWCNCVVWFSPSPASLPKNNVATFFPLYQEHTFCVYSSPCYPLPFSAFVTNLIISYLQSSFTQSGTIFNLLKSSIRDRDLGHHHMVLFAGVFRVLWYHWLCKCKKCTKWEEIWRKHCPCFLLSRRQIFQWRLWCTRNLGIPFCIRNLCQTIVYPQLLRASSVMKISNV